MIRRVLITLLGLWAFFCACLFHWIGLIGEAFRFDVSSLVFLRWGVSVWLGQASVLLLITALTDEKLKNRMRLAGMYLGYVGITFDMLLGLFGQAVSVFFWLIPVGHGVGTLLLWRAARTNM